MTSPTLYLKHRNFQQRAVDGLQALSVDLSAALRGTAAVHQMRGPGPVFVDAQDDDIDISADDAAMRFLRVWVESESHFLGPHAATVADGGGFFDVATGSIAT